MFRQEASTQKPIKLYKVYPSKGRGVMRILLTGVGCPGAIGTIYSLRNNPSRVKILIYIVGVDIDHDAVGKFFCDIFYPVPPPESADYIPALKKLIEVQKIDIIIPQTTREIVILSQRKKELACAVMVNTFEMLNLYNSKNHLLNLCEKHDLLHGGYHLATNRDTFTHFVRKLGYPHAPVVIKPAVGNGGRGVHIVDATEIDFDAFIRGKLARPRVTLEEAVRVLGSGDDWPEMLVMEYLPGQEYTVDVLNTPDMRLIISRKRNKIRSGISFITEIVNNQRINRQIDTLLDNYPLYGAIGFQFKENESGAPCILESNPRIQGTMIAAHMAGSNIVWAAVEYFLCGKVLTPVPAPTLNTKFFRYWGGVCKQDDDVITI